MFGSLSEKEHNPMVCCTINHSQTLTHSFSELTADMGPGLNERTPDVSSFILALLITTL